MSKSATDTASHPNRDPESDVEDSASQEIRDLVAEALHCPELQLVLSADFSSARPGYRTRIREALSARVSNAAIDLLDLARVPTHPDYSISITHGRALGGFTLAPLPFWIGFDIEEIERVSAAVASRVQAPGDQPAPSPAHLWVAKEAVFKCLFLGHQPVTSMQIAIQGWTPISDKNYLFRARVPNSETDLNGYGIVVPHRQQLLCFFANASQLRSSLSDRSSSTRE